MTISEKLGILGLTGALALGMATTASAREEVMPDRKPVSESTDETINSQYAQNMRSAITAQMVFEAHMQSMGSSTGTRIHSDDLDLSRPVTVITAEELQVDWQR